MSNQSSHWAGSRRVSLLFLGNPDHDRRIQSFAEMFRAAGYVPTIYCSIPGRPEAAQSSGYVQLPQRFAGGPRMFLAHHSALRSKLTEIAQAGVIIACDLYSLRAAAQAKRRNQSAILIYDARELYTGLPAVASKPFVRYFWKRWERAGMLETDMICVTAPHDADAIFRVHSFLPRPILIRNIPLRRDVTPDRAYLTSLGIKQSNCVAVYVGGLQRDRGLHSCVEAIKQLPEHVTLLLIGGGSLEGELRHLVHIDRLAGRVIFTGPMPQERIMSVLAACHVGLSIIEANSPSYELALPSKIFEYLHAGCPVVSTELKHVVELFDHQPYIRYVDAMKPDVIASSILALAETNEQLRPAIEAASRQYSFEADFQKLETLLEERLAERG